MIEPKNYRLPEDYILPEAPWKDWRVVKRLGKGSYGTVYEIERVTDFFTEKAAMKVISIPLDQQLVKDYQSEGYDDKSISDICKSYLQDTVREYKLMRSLKGNEYIVSCDDIDYSEKKDSIGWNVYIRMELLTPFLEDPKSNNLDELDIIRLGKDICQALIKCESKNIIHRDVKPGNIYVSKEGNYKLGDFGVARTLDHATNATRVGTERFMAPEVIKQDKYGKDVDLYSLGLVLYWLLNGRRMPFLNADKVPTAHENLEAYSKRLNGIRFGPPKNGSLFLKRVVLKACAYERSERYQSADEMLQALSRAEELYIKEQSSVSPTLHSPVSDAKNTKELDDWSGDRTIPKPVIEMEDNCDGEDSKTLAPDWVIEPKLADDTDADSPTHIVHPDPPFKNELPAVENSHFVRNAIIGISLVLCIFGIVIAIVIHHDASQSNTSNNSSYTEGIDSFETITLGNIEWIILTQENGKALLLTKDILEYRPYNEDYESVTWETCSLRSYLNGTWYNNTFSDEEKAKILITNVENPDNSTYGTSGGNTIQDNVFLLSIDEANQYFSSDDARIAKLNGVAAWWWLRSPGNNSYYSADVDNYGCVNSIGYFVNGVDYGVRPALWVNLNS